MGWFRRKPKPLGQEMLAAWRKLRDEHEEHREQAMKEHEAAVRERLEKTRQQIVLQSGEEKACRKQVREFAVKLGRANALNNQHTSTIRALNKAVQDYQRNLSLAQAAVERLTQERDQVRREAADLAAEKTILADQLRTANASLTGTREQLRQAKAERTRTEEDLAEARTTINGLGLEMAELEKRLEHKDFLDDDRRHVRLMDGQGDQ